MLLQDKKILLAITGGIAAYKALELIRLLTKAGAKVKTILTQQASGFVTPLSIQALSGDEVFGSLETDATHAQMTMPHIDLARWADLVLIAPATAHCLAKLAHGLADDLLTSVCLATVSPIVVAPAMNKVMWAKKVTQENCQKLSTMGIHCLGPDQGLQACGDDGPGRFLEPYLICEQLVPLFQQPILQGLQILISAGPTREAIDPIRFISNHSSGTMGYALAEVASLYGAEVTLISGPTALLPPVGVTCIDVVSAEDMYQAVMAHITEVDVFISSAAVADYRPKKVSYHKIKKANDNLLLELERTRDILQAVAQLSQRPFTIGFAAETENVLANATKKLQQKQLDAIVANRVGKSEGFGNRQSEIIIIDKENTAEPSMCSFNSKKHHAITLMNWLSKKKIPKRSCNLVFS